jgi:hypothetical protein
VAKSLTSRFFEKMTEHVVHKDLNWMLINGFRLLVVFFQFKEEMAI